MTNDEFDGLEAALEQAFIWLNWLQKKYREQTGRDYVLPLRVGFADEVEFEDKIKDRR